MTELQTLQLSAFLAGQTAAHVIDDLVGGGTFTPLAFVGAPEGITLVRLVTEPADIHDMFHRILAEHPEYIGAAMGFDGYITLPEGRKTDALMLRIVNPKDVTEQVVIAVPYSPKRMLRSFRLNRPKVVEYPQDLAPDNLQLVLDGLWAGLEEQPEKAALWDKVTDNSR